jgi:hypothetical protein
MAAVDRSSSELAALTSTAGRPQSKFLTNVFTAWTLADCKTPMACSTICWRARRNSAAKPASASQFRSVRSPMPAF